jgi:hypothetical protein
VEVDAREKKKKKEKKRKKRKEKKRLEASAQLSVGLVLPFRHKENDFLSYKYNLVYLSN